MWEGGIGGELDKRWERIWREIKFGPIPKGEKQKMIENAMKNLKKRDGK